MFEQEKNIGRVIRVGRGWVDVSVARRVRRISTRPDLLVKVGAYLQIVNDQGVALLPNDTRHIPKTMQ